MQNNISFGARGTYGQMGDDRMTGPIRFAVVAAALTPPAWAQPPAEAVAADADRTIVITGTRLGRPNDDSASPIQTVTAEAFTITGVANVEQTLNQLPQLVAGFTNTSNNPGTGAATLDLRGLGSVRTLVLVNGRRWIASDAGKVPEVDVNTIPAALIERVDIVTGGASAVYGSDAVTGVVNFVLRRSLEGLHLEARQSLTARGDGRVSSADLSFGTRFADGRGNVLVSAGWLDQAPVTQAARLLSRVSLADGCAVPGTRGPTGASTPVNDPACAPPNELALIAGGSNTIPGSLVSGPHFFPVAGSDRLLNNLGLRFDPDGTPRPFILATDRYNFAPDNYLQVGFTRRSANLLASYEIAPAATPYVELAYIETRSPQQLAPVAAVLGGGAGTVPVVRLNLANPFLTPAAAQVLEISHGVDAQGNRGFLGSPATGFRVNPAFTGDADGIVTLPILFSRLDLGPRQLRNARDAVRGLAGVRGRIAPDWDYDAFVSHSRVDHVTAFANSGSASRLQQALLAVRDPATGQPVCINPAGGCVPANIFGAGNLSAEAAAFLRTDPTDLTIIEEQVAEASLRGHAPLLPAGPAGFVFGATWRRSAYDFTPDPSLFTGDDLGFQPGTPAGGSTRVWELFTEARVPLLAGRPFVHELTVELGLRYSRYDSVGAVWAWKALGEWSPLAGLRLRGGYQRAVRAPNVRELYEQPVTSFIGIFDYCSADSPLIARPDIAAACIRNGVPANLVGTALLSTFALGTSRGNPDLDAERARTLTLGGVLAPRAIAGLSFALDYFDIRIRQAIGVFGGGGGFVISGCITGGGDPADPLCQAYDRGPDGNIRLLDLPAANLAVIRARGIDWQLAYGRNLGLFVDDDRLDLQFAGTRVLENGFQPNANLPAVRCAGSFGIPCGNTITGTATPRWKLFNQARYRAGPVSVTVRHRWFSATRDARIALAGARGFVPPRLPEEGARLEGRHYLDLAAGFRASDRFELTMGVNNLTGRPPALAGTNQIQANTDPSLYDVLGRRFFLALSLRLF